MAPVLNMLLPVRKKSLTVKRIVGDILLVIFLRMVVVIRSRSQDELNDWDSKLVNSSRVTGAKEAREGRGEGGE